jgi:hypothetical protein
MRDAGAQHGLDAGLGGQSLTEECASAARADEQNDLRAKALAAAGQAVAVSAASWEISAMPKTLYALLAAMVAAPTAAPAQVAAPLSPYPQCQPNKASTSAPCTCGVRPSTVCPSGSWCSFTPEGAPICSRRRPLH